jgi:hypothetical protein
VTDALKHLKNLGIAAKKSGKQRDRVFVYRGYAALLKED